MHGTLEIEPRLSGCRARDEAQSVREAPLRLSSSFSPAEKNLQSTRGKHTWEREPLKRWGGGTGGSSAHAR